MPMILSLAVAAMVAMAPEQGVRAVDDNRVFKQAVTEQGEKYSCKRILKAGTRVSAKKVCHTDAEWADRQRESNRAVHDAMAKSNGECRGC